MMRKRFRLLVLFLMLVLTGALVWNIYRAAQREKLGRPLIAAIKQNDVAAVQKLLALGADPNVRDTPETGTRSLWQHLKQWLQRVRGKGTPSTAQKGTPALALAVHNDNAAIVSALIARGADANVQDANGVPVLLMAARGWRTEAVKALLAGHPAVNIQDSDGVTPLLWAIKGGDAESAQALLARGAEVNAREKEGRTALMLAAD